MQQTAVNRLNRLLVMLLLLLGLVWLVLPFAMAILWSLVDPAHPWSYPDVFPPVLSLLRWSELWNTTSLPDALLHSYLLAPCVTVTCLLLAMPTAYAFGRLSFPAKGVAQLMTLLPIVLPGFVIAVFLSSLLMRLGVYSRFMGIFVGHTVLFMPYAIRILSVSFSQVRQDLVDAARNLGASRGGDLPGCLLAIPAIRRDGGDDYGVHPLYRRVFRFLHRGGTGFHHRTYHFVFIPWL
ncbi:hypothetical protein OS11_02650 [Dickeya oryzae]